MVAKEAMMPAPRNYPDELRDRALRLVREDGEHGAIARVADRLDINRETLRNWVNASGGAARSLRSRTSSGRGQAAAQGQRRVGARERDLEGGFGFLPRELDRPQRR